MAILLRALLELLGLAGQRVHAAWPRVSASIVRDVLFGTLVGASLARDAAALFSGPGISRTPVGLLGRWLVPIVGALLAVLALELLVRLERRLQSARMVGAFLALSASLLVAGVLLRLERLPQLDVYVVVRRYCDLGAFFSVVWGLSLLDRGRPDPSTPPAVAPLRVFAPIAALVAMVATMPWLFPSSGARLALASRSFIATPAVHGLRHLVDLDRDGYSPLLGGGDCNDLDDSVHPFLRDRPGDGVDQDCDGVDGWTPEPVDPGPALAEDDHPALAELRARARGKNVLVVLVDALRVDRLKEPLASACPRIAQLAGQSIAFARALSPASRTPLAVPAILDGRREGPGNGLFHAAHAAGVRTGFVSVDIVADQLRLARRFDGEVELADVHTEGERSLWGGGVHVFTASAVSDLALRWLDERPAGGAGATPWLLWVHYFSAHQWDAIDALRGVPEIARRYDAALADDDRGVGALLDGLAARGLADSTVVVLVSDHGEALGDHGVRTHGGYLYPELVHVPMTILVPGVAPRSIPTDVPAQALTPTLLDLVGIAAMPSSEVASSLLPLMVAGAPPTGVAPLPIVMQDTFQSSIALGGRLLRFTPADNATELLALNELDAPHPFDLVAREPDTTRRLSRLLVSRLSP